MGRNRSICIDISNIIPGKGGSGGGIATYSINLIKNLDVFLEGKNVTVICLKNSEYQGLEDLKNIKVVSVSLNNNNLFSRIYWLNVRLPYLLKHYKIDLLHRVIPELPLFKVCKYAITMHDFMFDLYLDNPHLKRYLSAKNRFKFHFLRHLSKLAIKSSDLVIVPAETIKDELTQKYGAHHSATDSVVVIHEASEQVDDGLMEEYRDDSSLKIGVIAGFYPHKGHLKVLDLAKRFLEVGFTDFKISFRGSQVYANYVAEIRSQIANLGLDDYVYFEPFKIKITLGEIYSGYDVILLLSEYEGFGLPVLEAQAHSLPVVCSDIPIFRENLQDSAIYLKSEYTNEEVLVLIEQLKDKDNRAKIASSGDFNVKKFSWQKMADATINSYHTILGS